MVISNGNVATSSDSNANGEVGDALPADLTQIVALIVEHLDTVGPVVADENLLVVVHCHTIGELKMPGIGLVMNTTNSQRTCKYLEQENLAKTLPTISKMTTLITLHSTTTILPQGSTATPRGCCSTSAPNFLMNCPYLLNICT